jgi:hypothetical protein
VPQLSSTNWRINTAAPQFNLPLYWRLSNVGLLAAEPRGLAHFAPVSMSYSMFDADAADGRIGALDSEFEGLSDKGPVNGP